MHPVKITRVLLFYRHYCTAPVIISLVCCVLYYLTGTEVVEEVFTKIFTDTIVIVFMATVQKDKLYYYYNLHLSKVMLFGGFLIIDLAVFCFCLWITTHIPR